MADHTITTRDQLRTLYREPSARAANKVFTSIDDKAAEFIDACPLAMLATTNGESIDVSPRGGPPGFILRISPTRIAIPDLNGNNRLDSFENILTVGQAGLLMLIPGKDETLRLNGPCHLSTDPEILARFIDELARPTLAVVIDIDELFGHCAKAFRRSAAWDPRSWAANADAPDLADLYAKQFGATDAATLRSDLETIYSEDLERDRPQ